MVYTWQFAPGSFLNLIWKNSVNQYESGNDVQLDRDYFGNLKETFRAPQTNNLTLKVIYYLDYLTMKRAFKRG